MHQSICRFLQIWHRRNTSKEKGYITSWSYFCLPIALAYSKHSLSDTFNLFFLKDLKSRRGWGKFHPSKPVIPSSFYSRLCSPRIAINKTSRLLPKLFSFFLTSFFSFLTFSPFQRKHYLLSDKLQDITFNYVISSRKCMQWNNIRDPQRILHFLACSCFPLH